VAISPDVVSFLHQYFGYCDLLWSSGIRNVARKASRVSLATGMARNSTLLRRPPGRRKPWPPSPLPPGRGFSFCAASVGGLVMRKLTGPGRRTCRRPRRQARGTL
jgi:hypothetical protein